MTDLLSWLRSALDDDERDLDVHYVVCSSLPANPDHTAHGMGPQECDCGEPEQLRRTVAAHREILDNVLPELLDMEERDEGEHGPYDPQRLPSAVLLRSLAAIYRESHPGFDPSWIPEDPR